MKSIGICYALVLALPVNVLAGNIDIGTLSTFAVLASSTVTNTGFTQIHGDLGVGANAAVTGFPPGIVTQGSTHIGDANAIQAQMDLANAYQSAKGASCNTVLTGQDLAGLTLDAGVYCFGSSAQLTGTLALDGQGNPNAVFIFQIASTLNTSVGSAIVFANGARGDNLFWQVGSSATLGTATAFSGNILSYSSVTLNNGVSLECGRALAMNGAVTLDDNDVSIVSPGCGVPQTPSAPTPEPSTAALALLILPLGLVLRRRSRQL